MGKDYECVGLVFFGLVLALFMHVPAYLNLLVPWRDSMDAWIPFAGLLLLVSALFVSAVVADTIERLLREQKK